MPAAQHRVDAYTRTDVETAPQGKLIVMLFNGAIKRTEEARRQIERRNFQEVHNNLIRAQDIIAELRGALNMKAGDIARNLDRIYEYLQHLLITANVQKSGDSLGHCVDLMTSMRNTWQEVFDKLTRESAPGMPPPTINQHGNAFLNLEG